MIIYPQESYDIIGAAIDVHKEFGCGLLEEIYQEAFEQELILRKIPYEREKALSLSYKGIPLKKTYRVDFVCYGKIIVELKAVEKLVSIHEAQILNYLNITKFHLGILINFSEESLKYKRIVK